MKSITKFLVIISILALVGCAQQKSWMKPNSTASDFENDKYQCLQQSQQRVGVAQVNAYGGNAVNSVTTNDMLFTSCMNSKGWSLQNKDIAQAQAQQQVQRNEELKNIYAEWMKGVRATCNSSELKEYYAKSACLAQEISFEQLADDTKITKEQKEVLPKQRQAVAENRKISDELQVKYFGELGRRRIDLARTFLDMKNDANNLDLYNGKITWGQYNKVRKDIAIEFELKMKEIK